jgi:hypothetical protein
LNYKCSWVSVVLSNQHEKQTLAPLNIMFIAI